MMQTTSFKVKSSLVTRSYEEVFLQLGTQMTINLWKVEMSKNAWHLTFLKVDSVPDLYIF